jgi:hypothetical protein
VVTCEYTRKKQTRCSTSRGRGGKPLGVCRRIHGTPTDEIQDRAYRIHLDHGGLHGYDLDDWLHAERRLIEAHRAARIRILDVERYDSWLWIEPRLASGPAKSEGLHFF